MKSFLPMLAAGLLILFPGCTSNRPHRTNFTPSLVVSNTPIFKDAVVEFNSEYHLGFIEFDDQGWFWNTNQLQTVEEMIRTAAKYDQKTNAEGVVVLLFVHGWKNNAAWDNDNVKMFHSALEDFNKAEQIESKLQSRKPRPIVGVFAGWRGLSATMEPFKELSFYERKNTAHKIGYGAVTEMLLRMEALQTACNKRIPEGAPKTELIIVGHSFGGAAVYSAISQILTERFITMIIEHHQRMKPLGDLVILLNPAFEATRYYNLNELASSVGRFPENQRPVLAIFTSKADSATGFFFPLGRFFSTLFEKTRHDKPQQLANLKTVGHFQPFITHDLIYDPTATNSTLNPSTKKFERPSKEHLTRSVTNVVSMRAQWRANTTAPSALPVTYSFDDCRLQQRTNYVSGDPFLVVSVDKQIMKGHSDINNPLLVNFLREFILFSRTNPVKQPGE